MNETLHSTPHRRVDALIAGLCGANAELREENAALEALAQARASDIAAHKMIAVDAITHSHHLRQQLTTVTERYHRALDDNRTLRAENETLRAENRELRQALGAGERRQAA